MESNAKNDIRFRIKAWVQRDGGDWEALPVIEETPGFLLLCKCPDGKGMQCGVQNLSMQEIAVLLAHSPICTQAILSALPVFLLAEKLQKEGAGQEIDAEALLTNLAKNSGGGTGEGQ